mgnify:CR=1 FL=1
MGSEMCIRDSGRWKLESFERLRPLIRAGDPLAGSIGDWVLWGPCLLYTSDAADERSSVDLGGRRIIKKKKREIMLRCGSMVTTHVYACMNSRRSHHASS